MYQISAFMWLNCVITVLYVTEIMDIHMECRFKVTLNKASLFMVLKWYHQLYFT
jgi:hypothetical protein